MPRRIVLLIALAAAGCGGEPERALCTTTSPLERRASAMSEDGRPLETWLWNQLGLESRTEHVYDGGGRLVEQRIDTGPGPGSADPMAEGPDGEPDTLITIAYLQASAEVSLRDVDTGTTAHLAGYMFDAAGRPIRVDDVTRDAHRQIRMFAYGGDGRIVSEDVQELGASPIELHREFAYGDDGRPTAMRIVRDGLTYDWSFRYEEDAAAPGRTVVTPHIAEFDATPYLYETDAAGRLTRVENGSFADHRFQIGYADDGAVAVLRGDGSVQTYSAECGVTFEVPRGPAAPRGPGPDHYALPAIPSPYSE